MVSPDFDLHFAFLRSFEVRPSQLPSSASGRQVFYYPGAKHGGQDGPIFEVVPNDSPPWICVFAAGKYGGPAVGHRLLGWPDSASFCVVSEGRGYVVRADDPEKWFEVELYPITDVRVVEDRLVVFADFVGLVAYAADGVAWRTARLSWDGVTISEVSAGELRGFGWNAADEQEAPFTVDTQTGESSGGASPDLD